MCLRIVSLLNSILTVVTEGLHLSENNQRCFNTSFITANMLVWFFLQKLLIFFYLHFSRKAYLAYREVQSERRNYEESTSNWRTPARMSTACADLLQASLCTLPLAAGHTKVLCFRKIRIVYIFWQIPDETKLETSPISHVDH